VPYLKRILGVGLRAPKTRVPGTNVAGHVDAVGKDVTRFQQGDEVYGTCKGSFAEHACAREKQLAPKPATLTFRQVAGVPHAGFAALQALRDHGEGPIWAEGVDRRCLGSGGKHGGAAR
jgi:NADPH:quinone reductase-like Zn-dependent oxidoreductase